MLADKGNDDTLDVLTLWSHAGPYLRRAIYGINPHPEMATWNFFSTNSSCLYTQHIKKTLPPETFPGLKISPKCVCCRGSAAPDPRPPLAELIVLPRPTIWIKGGEGRKRRERERRGRDRKGREKRWRIGGKGLTSQTKSLATALGHMCMTRDWSWIHHLLWLNTTHPQTHTACRPNPQARQLG